jgi:AcrR family transcriptional regulator
MTTGLGEPGVHEPGLRERRKRETRQAISDMATRMFLEHGFEAVTIAQVAAAAGVAKMTVTNYFPRKEDLVFDRAEGIISSLADAVRRRAPGESILHALRRDYTEAVARADVTLGLAGPEFTVMVGSSPALSLRGLEISDRRERALGDVILADTGVPEVRARTVAALLASVHRALYAEGARRSLAGEPGDVILAQLAAEARAAFDLLEPALGHFGVRPEDPPVPS